MVKQFLNQFMPAWMSAIVMLMIVVMVAVPVLSVTGCTKAEAVNVIDTLESQLPQIAQMADGLTQLVAPEYAPLIGPGAALIAQSGKTLESLLTGYNPAIPNPTTLQKVNAAWKDIQANLQGIINAVGVKDPKTTAIVTTFAGLIGIIAQNIVSLVNQQPATVAANLQARLPAVFGWHISGMDMIAIDGTPVGQVIKSSVTPRFTARDIAKHWNRLCSGQAKAKIKVPRARVLGLPIPGTGH